MSRSSEDTGISLEFIRTAGFWESAKYERDLEEFSDGEGDEVVCARLEK